ncbi:MAG: sigma 54-interacting transcriptional regulator [Candidatus Hydrogenedentes bacterium]|nr:sigma 54-interacting transcriptional regulator [Candidatus Hydrogenedentota bacterium]
MYDDPHSHATPPAAEALGQSEAFLDFQERLSRVAQVERPVLLLGERGTGKELAAKRLHYLSKRWQEPLVELNCAALTPTLIESELFGHEAGAFTGAGRRRLGRFEAANEGTLFLDELGNVPMEVQAKILRVVEYGAFERVGSTEPVRVDVRLVGATNADLSQLADEGRFMRDLLDRLSFEVLYLPPLRERKEDIMLLAEHFAVRMCLELGRQEIPVFSAGVIRRMEEHPWRGNVRELKNVVERAVYQSEAPYIEDLVFDPFRPLGCGGTTVSCDTPLGSDPGRPLPRFKEAVEHLELDLLQRALTQSRFNQREAAELLGLSYDQFRGLYRKYGGQKRL